MPTDEPGVPRPHPWLTRYVVYRGLPHAVGGYDRAEMTDVGMRYSRKGRLHRLDGPACTWPDESVEWYRDGLRHREDGPAVDYTGGRHEWWLDGVRQPDPRIAEAEQQAQVRAAAAEELAALETEVRAMEAALEARRRDLIRARVKVAAL